MKSVDKTRSTPDVCFWVVLLVLKNVKMRCPALEISHFIDRILMAHIDIKRSLESKLQMYVVYSTRIRSRKWIIFEILQQLNFNPSVTDVQILKIPSVLHEPTISIRSSFWTPWPPISKPPWIRRISFLSNTLLTSLTLLYTGVFYHSHTHCYRIFRVVRSMLGNTYCTFENPWNL